MKCPECDGRGYLEELLSTKYLGKFPQYKMIECSVCHGKGEINAFKPMTNEEWFCSLSTEEKAKAMKKLVAKWRMNNFVENYFLDWLKEVHHESV